MEEDLTWDGKYTTQYSDDVLQNCVLETCILLLTSVTPINSVKNENVKNNFILKNKIK